MAQSQQTLAAIGLAAAAAETATATQAATAMAAVKCSTFGEGS